MNTENVAAWVAGLGCLAILALMVIGSLIGGAIIYFFWNFVVVPFTGWNEITYLMAWISGAMISLLSGALRSNVSVSSS